MDNIPENRRKGYKILDDDGKWICSLARNVKPYDPACLPKDFCDWQIPTPQIGEPIHPAIIKFFHSQAA